MNNFFSELRSFRKQIINTLIEIKLTQQNPHFFHQTIIPNGTYSPWKTDEEFLKVFEYAKENTLVDIYRLFSLWELVKQTNNINGNIIEVGVWKGGSSLIIGTASNKKGDFYVCDTFEGVVKAGTKDTMYKGGEHSNTNVNQVSELLQSLSIDNVKILKGIFPDDFTYDMDKVLFRFCHIDVDVYQSALDVFNYVWPRLNVGGIIVFDDYGFLGCEGITSLVNDLQLTNGTKIYNINGQAILVKNK